MSKPLDYELDLGNLLVIDPNQLDIPEGQEPTEKQLLDLGRDGSQVLLNALWQLETERVEEAVVAKLPPPTYKLPREKPCPKPKMLTKWEKYAKEKGKHNFIILLKIIQTSMHYCSFIKTTD